MKNMIIIVLTVLSASNVLAQTPNYDALIRSAEKGKDTASIIRYFFEKNKRAGPDTAGTGRIAGNNLIYDYVFTYSATTKAQLKKGVSYMELILKNIPDDAMGKNLYGSWCDTYAQLLYRLGKKEKAIIWQQKAIDFWPDNQEHKDHLERIKQGIPTWHIAKDHN